MNGGRVRRRSLATIELYQRAMEGRPSPCRFSPSCSAYAHEAIEVHGARRGLTLALRRLVRCRPFGPSGWDPVPESLPRRVNGRAAPSPNPVGDRSVTEQRSEKSG
ncbi:membrane protein insertion efficiency factor YidD [Ilumatobacter sp.]|uniref:membrane protein insertion efficiency factor YidD n=1 Tax=Ilumatobacter sp. TaxID=1967498 RepID=UPI003B515DB5